MQLQCRCSTTSPRQLRLVHILRPRRQHQGGCPFRGHLGQFLSSPLRRSTSRIKSATCVNLPQPRLPTPTIFDGSTPTFPESLAECPRELRAYLNISQLEYIDRPPGFRILMQSNLLLQTSWCSRHPAGHRQHQGDINDYTQAHQDLREERATTCRRCSMLS